MRRYLMCFAMAAVLVIPARAGAQENQRRETGRDRDGLLARVLNLVPPAIARELNLTAEQRTQIEALEQQFKQKRQATLMNTIIKVTVIVKSLDDEENAEPAPVLAISHEITGCLLTMRRTRFELEKKVLTLLDDRQRAEFVELKNRGRRDDRDVGRDRGRDADDGLFSPRIQERLNLTAEQKQKLMQLHRDWEAKLQSILTAEQKERLDGLRRGRIIRGQSPDDGSVERRPRTPDRPPRPKEPGKVDD
jgi:Spy/CpxP family protein refolding chaperone